MVNEIENTTGKRAAFLVYTGSRLHGTSTPDSDRDVRGFFLPDAETLLGRRKFEQYERVDGDLDVVVFSFHKFFNLLEKGIPNIYEILFVPDELIIKDTELAIKLRNGRNAFLSKETIKTYMRFAKSEFVAFQRTESFKRAMHAIRLLLQANELLQHGKMEFPFREEIDLLMKIRRGEMGPMSIESSYRAIDAIVSESLESSSLPENLNKDELDALFYDCISDEMRSRFGHV